MGFPSLHPEVLLSLLAQCYTLEMREEAFIPLLPASLFSRAEIHGKRMICFFITRSETQIWKNR